jgi:hypothetical protein
MNDSIPWITSSAAASDGAREPDPGPQPVFTLHVRGALRLEVYRVPRRLLIWVGFLSATGASVWGALGR